MRQKRVLFAVFLLLLLVENCIHPNPFSQFYTDLTGDVDITKAPNIVLPTEDPKLFRGSNLDDDYIQMLENGYLLLGYSSFNAGNVYEHSAVIHGRDISASVILMYSNYTDTETSTLPLMFPKTITSTTSSTGNIYGSGGRVQYYDTTNTVSRGTQPVYYQRSVRRYDYFASYWIKAKEPIMGIHVRDLTPELRKVINSNKGLLIIAVIKNSPAFMADIFRGDILKRIEEIEIIDIKSFSDAVTTNAGKVVKVLLIRDGKEIVKEVKMNQRMF